MEANLRNGFLGEIDDRCCIRCGRKRDINNDHLVCISVEKNGVFTAWNGTVEKRNESGVGEKIVTIGDIGFVIECGPCECGCPVGSWKPKPGTEEMKTALDFCVGCHLYRSKSGSWRNEGSQQDKATSQEKRRLRTKSRAKLGGQKKKKR